MSGSTRATSRKGVPKGPVVHKLTNVRPELQVADCAGCGPDSPIVYKSSNKHWRCRVGNRRSTPESRYARQLRFTYGLDTNDYDRLLAEQGGSCAICDRPCASGRRLAVDHDHACCPTRSCGKCVRGLLCGTCNRSLGGFRDDPELLLRAVAYLANH